MEEEPRRQNPQFGSLRFARHSTTVLNPSFPEEDLSGRIRTCGQNKLHAHLFGEERVYVGFEDQWIDNSSMADRDPTLTVDEMEERGLIERRDNPDERRSYALHITEKGRSTLETIGGVSREHSQALFAAISEDEQRQLATLLQRIADQQWSLAECIQAIGMVVRGECTAGLCLSHELFGSDSEAIPITSRVGASCSAE